MDGPTELTKDTPAAVDAAGLPSPRPRPDAAPRRQGLVAVQAQTSARVRVAMRFHDLLGARRKQRLRHGPAVAA
ncbi:hypothetical protein [Streptomyces sp. NPDC020362]|uniref:hypothetical protein n=1 Tax=Streptomyces sp. NPDC020362 TaxID=3154486 RepID=UPI0033EF5433